MIRKTLALFTFILPLSLAVACDNSSPTAPSSGGGTSTPPTANTPAPTPTPPAQTTTHTIRLEADLNFGTVPVGTTVERVLRIYNEGTAPLNVSGIQMTASIVDGFRTNYPTPVAIAPGTSIAGAIRFTPTDGKSYSGTLTVQADHTGGTNTMPISAVGERPRWSMTGTGDSVLDMPTSVRRVRIIGIYNGYSSNFQVRVGGSLIVNELLGDAWPIGRRFQGDYLVSGGVTAITRSSGVQWSFEELR